MDSAEPNSKEILLRLRQHFVLKQDFCRRKIFFRREIFVDARFLSTRVFCRREYFVDVSILLCTTTLVLLHTGVGV